MDSHNAGILGMAVMLLLGTCFAQAGDVSRCVGAHGEPMFAQQCPDSSASSQRTPAARIADTRGATSPAGGAAGLCARSPQTLADRVQAALHARNGVRLSGFVLWRGVSSRGSRGEVRQLLQLIKTNFADVQLKQRDADEFSADTPGKPGAEYGLVVTSMQQDTRELRSAERWFGVARERGCYWLTLAPPAWQPVEPEYADDAAAPALADAQLR